MSKVIGVTVGTPTSPKAMAEKIKHDDIGAEKAGSVDAHNLDTGAHNDIRLELAEAKKTATNASNKVNNLEGKMDSCVSKNQGVGNAGKILMVDANGNLTLTDVPEMGLKGDIVGVMEENNVIVLTGDLPEGVYPLKFRMEDGTLQDAGSINLESETVVPITLYSGKIDYNNNGAIVASDIYLYSDFIPNEPNKAYRISLVGEGANCSIKFCYYDSNNNYLGITERNWPDTNYSYITGSWSIPFPTDVAKIRLRVYHDNADKVAKTKANLVVTKFSVKKYTNVLATALGADGSVLDGVGYRNGYKPNSYPKNYSAQEGAFCTGAFPYTIEQVTNRTPLYIKGITLDLTNLVNIRLGLMTSYDTDDWCGVLDITDMTATDQATIVQLGEQYYAFIPNTNLRTAQGWNNKDMNYARISFPGSGEGVIITVDEPIL